MENLIDIEMDILQDEFERLENEIQNIKKPYILLKIA